MYGIENRLFAFLLSFIRKQKFGFFILCISSLSTALSSTIWPQITGQLVDAFEAMKADPDFSDLNYNLYFCLFFWLFIEFLNRVKGYSLSFVMPRYEANIRDYLFRELNKKSYGYLVHKRIGDLSYRVADLPRSANFMTDQIFLNFIPLIVAFLIAVSEFFLLKPILAVIFFVWVLLHFLLMFFFSVKAVGKSSIHNKARANLQGVIVDSIVNYLNVKIFQGFKTEKDYVGKAQDHEISTFRSSMYFVEKTKMVLAILGFFSISFLLYSTLKFWRTGEISSGDVVIVINVTLNLLQSIWWANDELTYFLKELGIFNQSLSLLDGDNEDEESGLKELNVTKGEIVFDRVSFEYRHGNNVGNVIFRDKSLTIHSNEKVGLVGLSGSGKTTFANLVAKLYKISEGTISIDKQNINYVSMESLLKNISYITQEPMLFHRSVLENIRYGRPEATMEEVVAASQQANCHNFITKMKNGYNTGVGERGSALSGGQRQRIAIARAILKGSPILVMDEATAALDSIMEDHISKSIENLISNRTVIVIAHRLSTLLNMDRILVFDNGVIIEEGTHESLLQRNGHYAKLWSMQVKGMLPDSI